MSANVARRDLPVVRYSSGSQLRRPGLLLRAMVTDLRASRELAWRLFVRNISAKYRQTLLGYVSAFLPPVAGTLVFVVLRRNGVFQVADPGVPYVLFLVVGLTLWQTFVDAVNAPLRLVNQSRSMLTKINFPREALILAGAAEVAFNFFVRVLLVAGVLLWTGFVPPLSAALLPLGVLSLVALGMALGIVLIPLAVLYQDVEQALAFLLSFWMFATPVFYPAPSSPSLVLKANPVAPLLDTARAWLLGGNAELVGAAAAIAAATLFVLFFGWLLYRLALPILIERMSS